MISTFNFLQNRNGAGTQFNIINESFFVVAIIFSSINLNKSQFNILLHVFSEFVRFYYKVHGRKFTYFPLTFHPEHYICPLQSLFISITCQNFAKIVPETHRKKSLTEYLLKHFTILPHCGHRCIVILN